MRGSRANGAAWYALIYAERIGNGAAVAARLAGRWLATLMIMMPRGGREWFVRAHRTYACEINWKIKIQMSIQVYAAYNYIIGGH